VRLALVSDVHANLEALEATLTDISARGVDRIVCLGDIVGYNTNPAECIALLREANALCIAGNHDRAVCGRIGTETFSDVAARAVAWTRARLCADNLGFLDRLPLKASVENELLLVHGALHVEDGCEVVRLDTEARRLESLAALARHPSGARLGAFGHTHRMGVYEYRDGEVQSRGESEIALREDAHYLLNPGSVGQSRSADPRATYMLLDTKRGTLTRRHVDYDASVPLAKTRKAGLAPPLWFLPPPIRDGVRQGLRAVGLLEPAKRLLRSL
jgi:predicted phosphodiesterase